MSSFLTLQYIRLKFEDFDIQPSFACRQDNIEIFDGSDKNTSPSIGPFCNTNKPRSDFIPFSSNKVLIHFKSDSSTNGRGFIIKYEFIPNLQTTPKPKPNCKFSFKNTVHILYIQ